jgi:TctA family transporter
MSEASSPIAYFLEPTFKRAARIWWAFFWRAFVFGVILLVLIVALLTTIGSIAGISHANMRPLVMIVCFVVNIPISIFAVQIALGASYGEFTVRLLPAEESHRTRMAPDLIP